MLIGFLNIFPQMQVKTYNSETGQPESTMTVPIMFGPIERSTYMNSEGQSVNRTVQMPLLHFELTNMELDKNRAFAMKSLHAIGSRSGVDIDNLMPQPWNFTIIMNIYAKYQEELMQLIEQIVPLFNYHRVYYTYHPIFSETITLPHWANITTYPNFAFNYDYPADERRGILAVPVTFLIESWLVRESYESYGLVKEIITNYQDYATQKGLSKVRLLADPTIREVIYTANPLYTPALGQLLSGSHFTGTIVDVASGFSGVSSYYSDGSASGWSGYSDGKLVVKFNTEKEVFLKNEGIRVGLSAVGTTCSCEPYKPFVQSDYGWSAYSGVSAVSGWSMYSGVSGYSTYVVHPSYSGYSEIKTDGVSGII
jgi:hypothetical protein